MQRACDNCYGPALGHELQKVGQGQDSICGGLFSGGAPQFPQTPNPLARQPRWWAGARVGWL